MSSNASGINNPIARTATCHENKEQTHKQCITWKAHSLPMNYESVSRHSKWMQSQPCTNGVHWFPLRPVEHFLQHHQQQGVWTDKEWFTELNRLETLIVDLLRDAITVCHWPQQSDSILLRSWAHMFVVLPVFF